MPRSVDVSTARAIELLKDDKYYKPTILESAAAILEKYPSVAPNEQVLSHRKPFAKAYNDRLLSEKERALRDDTEASLKEKLNDLRVMASQRRKQRENEARIKFLLKQLDEAEERFEILSGIKEDMPRLSIEPREKTSKREAVSFAAASDWHVEERVDGDLVNHLNEYNLPIAAERIKTFFQNILRLVNKERHTSTINKLVLWLGGDLLSGYIHEELMESNYLSPVEAIRFLKQHLTAGIDFLLRNGGLKEIAIPTSFGNHGRTGEKLKVGTGYKNSYEWLLYMDLADIYAARGEKRIKFSVAKGEFNFIQVFDKKVRMTHGYHIKYAGGVGGITVPAMKFIDRQNRIEKADYDVWGHHHQYFTNPFFCQNGSLIGISPYGRRYGGENPQQAYFTIDAKHGITTQMPIFATHR